MGEVLPYFLRPYISTPIILLTPLRREKVLALIPIMPRWGVNRASG